jgi:hypothetical protein
VHVTASLLNPASTLEPDEANVASPQQKHQRFTVCGHSSGGAMASNHFLAFSDRVVGLGQIESGNYACERVRNDTNVTAMLSYARESAAAGKIAPLALAARAPIYVMEGGNDTCAKTTPATSAAFYRLIAANQSQVAFHIVPHAEHGFVTDLAPSCPSCVSCGTLGGMVQECGYDMAGAMFTHLLGALRPRVPSVVGCAFFGSNLHLRMPLVLTPLLRLKRAGV